MSRTKLKTYGRYGATVNVFAMSLDGEDVARAEWRELDRTGRKVRKTETFRGPKREREKLAFAFAESKQIKLSTTTEAPVARRTIKDINDAFVLAHAPDWRPNTLRLHRERMKPFLTFVDPYTFADLVTPELLDAYRADLLGKDRAKTGAPMARNQVAHHIQKIKQVWKFARERKLLRENVIGDYAVRRGRDYTPLEVPEFTPAQFARIMGQLSPRSALTWRAWAAIALDGLLAPRSNAMLQLDVARDIDMRRRTVTWQKEHDKVGKVRVQPLPRDAVYVLRVCRVWARREGYTGRFLFYSPQERRRVVDKPWTYSALNGALHRACDRAGVARVTYRALHGLRRMRGKSVLELTGDITKVGAYLGDTDVRVLRKSYLRDRPEDLVHVVAGTSLPDVRASKASLSAREPSPTSPQKTRCHVGHLYTAATTRERKSPNGTIWLECLRCERDRKAGSRSVKHDTSSNETATAPTRDAVAKPSTR